MGWNVEISTPNEDGARSSRSDRLIANRDDLGETRAGAQGLAAGGKPARDTDFLARVALQRQVEQLTADRALLARELSRAYRKPLRPIRHALHFRLAKMIGALGGLLTPQASDRFARSAQAHNPKRFDAFLRDPGPTAARLWKFQPILTAQDLPTLAAADVTRVSLPTSLSPVVLPHQSVVVNSVKELFQIEVDHPAVPRSNMLLGTRHCLMCRASGTEPIARFREGVVPTALAKPASPPAGSFDPAP